MITKVIFEPGDVVYLRSGSPPMTITALNDDGTVVNVRWFEDETSYKDVIPTAALIAAQIVEEEKAREESNKTSRSKPRKKASKV